MGAMIRKQLYITAEQDEALKTQAKRLGVTESEVIRLGMDLQLASWARFMDRSRDWQALGPVDRGRMWTEDDIHDERRSGSTVVREALSQTYGRSAKRPAGGTTVSTKLTLRLVRALIEAAHRHATKSAK